MRKQYQEALENFDKNASITDRLIHLQQYLNKKIGNRKHVPDKRLAGSTLTGKRKPLREKKCSAFGNYFRLRFKEIRSQEAYRNSQLRDIMPIVGKEWKELSAVEKLKYIPSSDPTIIADGYAEGENSEKMQAMDRR
jgi:hypothetical protein